MRRGKPRRIFVSGGVLETFPGRIAGRERPAGRSRRAGFPYVPLGLVGGCFEFEAILEEKFEAKSL